MTKEEVKILSIQFQDEEIATWKSIVLKLQRMAIEAGYNKTFNTDEVVLIKELNLDKGGIEDDTQIL